MEYIKIIFIKIRIKYEYILIAYPIIINLTNKSSLNIF